MDGSFRSEQTDSPPLLKGENGNDPRTDEFDSISSFYRNSTVFMTGVTGFLGHVLLCKLLSSCPDIRTIYILIRSKRNQTANERYEKIFSEPIFDKLKSDSPKILKKVRIIEGDCAERNLGISKEERDLLMAEVNVVFHVAATVRFDAPLSTAVNSNVRSTRDLLDMADNMRNLKAFVYVSTAYSNCAGRRVIEEKIYDPPLEPTSLIKVVDLLDDDVIDRITPALLQKNPNTYIFTKAISEGLFSSKNLPVAIFRPGIVTCTAKEPIPGWTNNVYGPTGVIVAGGLGLMRTLQADKNCKANIVPCDYVTNALIASAWYTAKKWQFLTSRKDEEMQKKGSFQDVVPIFNYSSVQTKKAFTWRQFMRECEIAFAKTPFYGSLWSYSITLNKYNFMDNACAWFLHLLPAYVVDTVGAACGKKFNLMKAYQKIHKMNSVISYFSTQNWILPNKRVQSMWNMLSDEDKRNFNFDLDTIDWKEYFAHYLCGVRQYVLKETPDSVPKAIRKQRRLLLLHYTLLTVITYLAIFVANIIYNFTHNLFFRE